MERQEIERIYPRDAFAEDCDRNARSDQDAQHGLLVSAEGVWRHARRAGVAEPPDTSFIAPVADESYEDFIDRVTVLAEALEIG